ncbi:MAG: DegT/DnrJ/EryC1/StrS family aminotransferase [Candidatus Thermoplasmatota archaeon]|nr:DegT/DnrJ/EryC1/StrS family aminotransferase [Candidatus Thermoplasmatota archaeon]MBU4256273.1 DegT/DnrJ/EryC1/StrS family aminotransferase [Candidatus Thermoplasmatota archaeon]MCG2825217.1 DegT/DnrJ/EryC1/StrS family aminotransferase [Thermoplasmatales archaeon]
MTWKIPLFKIYWDNEDIKMVNNAIKKGMFWAIGPEIEKFEKKISGYIGTKYAVSFNSGTSALHAALLAHGIKQGDEVIVPSFTFIATANAPLFVGAKPVFADIEEKTFGLDPEDVKEKITKKTKTIIPIHYGGCPCRIRELKEIAEDHNLILMEDAAESFGAKIGKKMVGTFGDSSMLSFCANKIITTGEGGCIVTDSKDIYKKLKLFRSHGRLETQNYFSSTGYMDYVTLGYNFRMSNITAALGIAQIKKVDKIIKIRREKADYMAKKLSKIKEVILPEPPKNGSSVYQMYTIRVKKGKRTRDDLMKYLAKEGIMTKVYFEPVHLTHFYRKKLGYKCKLPVAERLSKQVLTLPMYPALTKNEINYITDKIDTFFKG